MKKHWIRWLWLAFVLGMAWYCGRTYERRQVVERVSDAARQR